MRRTEQTIGTRIALLAALTMLWLGICGHARAEDDAKAATPAISSSGGSADTGDAAWANSAPIDVSPPDANPNAEPVFDASNPAVNPISTQLSYPPLSGEPGYTPFGTRPSIPLVFFFASKHFQTRTGVQVKHTVGAPAKNAGLASDFLPIAARPDNKRFALSLSLALPEVVTGPQPDPAFDDKLSPEPVVLLAPSTAGTAPTALAVDRKVLSEMETEETARKARELAEVGERGVTTRLLENLKRKPPSQRTAAKN